jgi:type I restriction enzyme M protein
VPIVRVTDALASDPGERFDVVLANPPFGKKSSTVITGAEGRHDRKGRHRARRFLGHDTSNKQLNFVQHIKTLLGIHGRAAVVLPDNVLFEGGAGETIRRKLLHECDVHTLLRLPDRPVLRAGRQGQRGVFRASKPASETPWTKKLWIYDLRTNQHFTLKTNPIKRRAT